MAIRALHLLLATALLLTDAASARRLDPGELDDLTARRGRAVLGGSEAGELEIAAGFVPEQLGAGALLGSLEVLVYLTPELPRHPRFRLSAIVENLDGEPAIHHLEAEPVEVGAAAAWFYRVRWELSEEVQEVLLVAEETESGLWGGCLVEFTEERRAPPGDSAVAFGRGSWSLLPRAGEAEGEDGAAQAEPGPEGRTVLRLLPPRKRDGQRFEALVADLKVRRVAFFLDGVEVGARDQHPWSVRIDLAGPRTGP